MQEKHTENLKSKKRTQMAELVAVTPNPQEENSGRKSPRRILVPKCKLTATCKELQSFSDYDVLSQVVSKVEADPVYLTASPLEILYGNTCVTLQRWLPW